MADLMVSRESVFEHVQLTGVKGDHDARLIEFSFTARQGRWFDPDDEHADPDGWVRDITGITMNGNYCYFTDREFEKQLDRMQDWLREGTVLTAGSSLERQATVMVDPSTGESVGVRQPDEMLDHH